MHFSSHFRDRRWRQCWLIGFLLIGLAGSMLPARVVQAATFTVTKTADSNDGTCDTDCSLREAIIAANTSPDADTIILPAGSYPLTIGGDNEDSSATGDLDITDSVTLTGAGATSTIIDADALDRVFDLAGSGPPDITVAISGVTLQNGSIADSGGGLLLRAGNALTLTDSIVRDNTSSGGDGGGGVYVQGSSSLSLVNSAVIGNDSVVRGGGIVNNNVLTVVNSTISDNTTVGTGGGIFSNNTSSLNNVTIANNTADNGGGISVAPSTALTLTNTLLAGNSNGSMQPSDCQGTLTSQGYNLLQSSSGCTFTPTTGDLIDQAPQVGALQDNGGPTPTHALLSGSLAIDAGSPAVPGSGGTACATTDQRGVTRPQDGTVSGTAVCDIGAYEREPWQLYLPLLAR
jgi:CSLREA domain-containing protein